MAEYRDPTPISPKEPEYDKSKVSKEVANYTQQVREKRKGHDVREALARNSEIADVKAEDAVATSYDTKARQDDVENRFDDQIAGNTDIDEVIDARRPEGEEAYPTLRKRLDEEHHEVTAQLAHIHYDVINEGSIGDGVSDDTPIIQNILDKMNAGESIYFPVGEYRITDTLTITKPITIKMLGSILVDHDKQGVVLKDDSPKGSFHPDYHNQYKFNGNLKIKRVTGKGYELLNTSIGVELWNVYSAKLYFEEFDNHYTSVRLIGDDYGEGYSGTTYCNFTTGVLNGYKKNYELIARNKGYVTQNQFYSGSLTGRYKEGVETIHIDLVNKGSSVINENTFFGCSLEGGFTTAVKLDNASANNFSFNRYEMPELVYLFHTINRSNRNIFEGGSMWDHMEKGKFSDLQDEPDRRTENRVTFVNYKYGYVLYFNRFFYIKPFTADNRVNYAQIESLPEAWKGKMIADTGGKVSQNSIRPQIVPYENGVMDVDFSYLDEFNIDSYGTSDLTAIRLTTPPPFSKDFNILLTLGSNLSVSITSEDSVNVVNLTDMSVFTTGRTLIDLSYNKMRNTIYIKNAFKL